MLDCQLSKRRVACSFSLGRRSKEHVETREWLDVLMKSRASVGPFIGCQQREEHRCKSHGATGEGVMEIRQPSQLLTFLSIPPSVTFDIATIRQSTTFHFSIFHPFYLAFANFLFIGFCWPVVVCLLTQ